MLAVAPTCVSVAFSVSGVVPPNTVGVCEKREPCASKRNTIGSDARLMRSDSPPDGPAPNPSDACAIPAYSATEVNANGSCDRGRPVSDVLVAAAARADCVVAPDERAVLPLALDDPEVPAALAGAVEDWPVVLPAAGLAVPVAAFESAAGFAVDVVAGLLAVAAGLPELDAAGFDVVAAAFVDVAAGFAEDDAALVEAGVDVAAFAFAAAGLAEAAFLAFAFFTLSARTLSARMLSALTFARAAAVCAEAEALTTVINAVATIADLRRTNVRGM